jgi:plastocyanin
MYGAVAALLLAGGALTACGDDDDTTTSSGSAAGSTGAAPVSLPGSVEDHGSGSVESSGDLDLELDDTYFAPTFVDAPAGSTVKVTLENEGKLAHTFTIDGTDVDEQVAAGEEKTVEVTLPATGSLRFYCRFHVGSGMQGAFVVSGDAAGATPTTAKPATTLSGSGGAVSGY